MSQPLVGADLPQLLAVRGLRTQFDLGKGRVITAVAGVDLDIAQGEIVGLVGESGSGKTVLALSLLRLVPPPGRILEGEIGWRGRDLMKTSEHEMRRIRGAQLAMIFQNPQASLNPIYSIGHQLVTLIRLHRDLDRGEAREEALRLLTEVGIPDAATRFGDYPHQLSGGLCQRAMIAMALGCQPALLIADEPTSALDVTIQAQILELLMHIRQTFGMSVLLISHDLGVVAEICDSVNVMRDGRILERGPTREVLTRPKDPYTQLLLNSIPGTNLAPRNNFEHQGLGLSVPAYN